jgi:hypothetical protein
MHLIFKWKLETVCWPRKPICTATGFFYLIGKLPLVAFLAKISTWSPHPAVLASGMQLSLKIMVQLFDDTLRYKDVINPERSV